MAVDLLTLGETLVCFAPAGLGRLDAAGSLLKTIGGAESNTAIGLSRLGRSVTWISRLGSDPFGDEICRRLRGEGIDVSYVTRDEAAPTGLMVKELRGPDEVNVFYYRMGSAASQLDASDIDEVAVQQSRRVHVTGITLALGARPRGAVHRLLELARRHDVAVSFDPNLRGKLWTADQAVAEIRQVLPYVDDLLLSEREAFALTKTSSLDPALEQLAAEGFNSVVVKCGSQGAVGIHAGEILRAPAEPVVSLIDSVGAGDAFNVGYLHSLLAGRSHVDALRLGNWVASRALSHWGDYEGLPELAEYEHFLSGHEVVRR